MNAFDLLLSRYALLENFTSEISYFEDVLDFDHSHTPTLEGITFQNNIGPSIIANCTPRHGPWSLMSRNESQPYCYLDNAPPWTLGSNVMELKPSLKGTYGPCMNAF